MKTPDFVQLHHDSAEHIRHELVQGLTANPQPGGATVSPKFLYDALGSRLFEAITELPEYYPTRTEAAIFKTHAQAMARAMPPGATLIDLGAGNCGKATGLFDVLRPSRYVAVDISVDFLRATLNLLQRQYPAMDLVGIGLDFSQTLELPPQAGEPGAGPRLLFYPGSSIGNFTPTQALVFLRQVRAACGPVAGSGLLIGVDLVKDATELEAAYDDALGVTAAFNRNLISNVNRLVGTDMRLPDWAHHALFNPMASRIEMHLVAQRDLMVQWPGGQRAFSQGERIHTENSYKWTVAGFSQLLREAGFAEPLVWTDAPSADAGRFAVMWAGA
ncbi:L-histidine N(alpha)-methyltransferase [Rhodoferax sp.]|uniref:L-histidine N(alpha)-methyltransferase n=1 Tax=Rhodoferax sp. TaxID=50421 RepID=UPI0025D430A5|nr:L-histidine N(alpha)-methyltransferase [Rhodoferax sp.]MCM2295169.1 L-histidine N(alpha)-methyltransferase [Rhodoferax sp.]